MDDTLKLSHEETEELRELGKLINYNDYGETEEVFIIHWKLYLVFCSRILDPFDFFTCSGKVGSVVGGFSE